MRKALPARARKLLIAALVGGGIGLLAAALCLARPAAIERLEYWSYDPRARAVAAREPASPDIVIVGIGDDDLRYAADVLGESWPWPREFFGHLVDFASKGGAKAVLLDLVFEDRGRQASDLEAFAAAMRESGRVVLGVTMPGASVELRAPEPGRFGARFGTFDSEREARAAALALQGHGAPRTFVVPTGSRFEVLYGGYRSAEDAARLAAALAEYGLLPGSADAPSPIGELGAEQLRHGYGGLEVLRETSGLDLAVPEGVALPERQAMPPVALLGAAAARMGNIVQASDPDGTQRGLWPLVAMEGRAYPALPLAGFLVGHPAIAPRLEPGALVLGERRVPLDETGRMVLRFVRSDYPRVGASDVLNAQAELLEGKTPALRPERFRDKYVIVSGEARALRDLRATPVQQYHPGAEINANALDNLLTGRAVRRASPLLDALFTLGLALLLSALVGGAWGAIRNGWAALLAAAAIVLAGGAGSAWLGTWLLAAQGVWIALSVPWLGAGAAVFAAVLATTALERHDKRFVQDALGRYTSPVLVKELLAHPERLSLDWGEVREISVYFSDIANFTSFSERLKPEQLVALLNDYLTHMTDIVLAHGGVVDKYIGDAIMAFWGAPLDEPRHALQAVRCAVAMRRTCEELREKWQREYHTLVIARAGINTGVAVAGNMGSRHKFNYTVMGDTVNLASRLEGANKPYGTTLMISETTYAQVKESFEVRELDLLAVKGKERPVTVYEVLEEKGRVAPGLLEAVGHYHAGLALYRAQRFAEAIALFERAVAVRGEDGPSQTYLGRCRHFLENPPGAGWDGVWHMKEK